MCSFSLRLFIWFAIVIVNGKPFDCDVTRIPLGLKRLRSINAFVMSFDACDVCSVFCFTIHIEDREAPMIA